MTTTIRKQTFRKKERNGLKNAYSSGHAAYVTWPGLESDFMNIQHAFGLSLHPSPEDVTLCYFYHTTLVSLPKHDNALFLHSQLPGLYTKSSPRSALRLAARAISFAFWNKLDPKIALTSRKYYSQALFTLQDAIQNPIQAKHDDTLYAVLLLSGYEVSLKPFIS